MIDIWFKIKFRECLLAIWLVMGNYLWNFTTMHYDEREDTKGTLCAITYSYIEEWDEID